MADWRDRLGRPKTLILYRTPDRWRHAIYGEPGDVLDGRLKASVDASPSEAQQELEQLACDIAREQLEVAWSSDRSDWWTGEVQPRP